MEAPEDETVVYRIYDQEGGLLYVGMTNDFDMRMYQHRRDSRWFPLAHDYRLTTYPTRRLAARAEWQAIRTEEPMFNLWDGRVAPVPMLPWEPTPEAQHKAMYARLEKRS